MAFAGQISGLVLSGKTLDQMELVFPQELVSAVGPNNLAAMRRITVKETGTGYLDDVFDNLASHETLLQALRQNGAAKGTDQYGRLWLSFAVTNQLKEELLITVLQRHVGGGEFCHRTEYSFSEDDLQMNAEKYAAIKRIFNHTHPTLTLYRSEEESKE